jgi:hypothetical protein
MRPHKLVLSLSAALWAVAALFFAFGVGNAPTAHSDYFNYPCNYPFVGQGGDVNIIVDAGGQYCDGPSEVNWSHYHCEGGGATVNVGALAFTGVGPVSLGGFGGSGIGGRYQDCQYRCPDGSVAPFPNPPAAWIKHLVLDPKDNDCVGHMGIRGPSSTPLPNALPGNIAPGDDPPDGVAVPAAPGALPDGQRNPDAKPGPPKPPVVGEGPETVPMPSGHPVTPDGAEGSPLTPGSPMQLP